MSILGTQPTPPKLYPGGVDNDSQAIFNMSVNDTTMYGTYYTSASPALFTEIQGVSAAIFNTAVSGISADLNTFLDENEVLDGGVV